MQSGSVPLAYSTVKEQLPFTSGPDSSLKRLPTTEKRGHTEYRPRRPYAPYPQPNPDSIPKPKSYLHNVMFQPIE